MASKKRKLDENLSLTAWSVGGEAFEVVCPGNTVGEEFWHILADKQVRLGSMKTLKVIIGTEFVKSELTLAEQLTFSNGYVRIRRPALNEKEA